MEKVKIIGTGLSGLVGSRILELLENIYEFEDLSLETGVDITNKEDVLNRIKKSTALMVIHLAAKTNVDLCEKDKEKDIKILGYKDIKQQEKEWVREKTAWAVNVLGTQNIAEACIKTSKGLLYVSTDFVFDGDKKSNDGYSEEDKPNPINWYARTKYEGEKIVQTLNPAGIIARLAYPYRASFARKDFVRAIIERLKNRKALKMVTDHIVSPAFIDDIVKAFDVLIKNNKSGIFHVVGVQALSPYDAAVSIAKEFNFNSSLISKTTRAEFFKDRAPRPFKLVLRNDKIQKLGIKMRSFEEGIKEVKRQISQNLK